MKKLNVLEQISLDRLTASPKEGEPTFSDWVRILRTALRMTQKQLAQRAKIAQPHLAGIERGKGNPRISTLKRIFDALSCPMAIEPRPTKPIAELLSTQARIIALKRLKQSMGTMALEGQAPTPEVFRQLLNKYTQEISEDRREQLWGDVHG